MLEAVSASPGHLLFIAPCGDCQHLMLRLRASGWRVDSCELAQVGERRVDVGLVCVGADAKPELLQLPRQLRGAANQWVALIQPDCSALACNFSGILDTWYFQHMLQPLDPHKLQRTLNAACKAARSQAQGENGGQLLGHSRSIRDLRKRLNTLAASRRPLLIEGEVGVGKTLLVQLLQQRASGEGELRMASALELPSDLFAGLGGGTLCLQHAEQLAPALLNRLLKESIATDVRLIVTAVPMQGVSAYLHRLCEAVVLVPLRQRQGDIVLLAEYFVQWHSSTAGSARVFSESALSAMLQHGWPGNVRELTMRVRRALTMSTGLQLQARDLGLHSSFEPGPGATLEDYKRRAEYQALCDALARYSSNLSLAAKSLGISRPTFYRLLHKHQLL